MEVISNILMIIFKILFIIINIETVKYENHKMKEQITIHLFSNKMFLINVIINISFLSMQQELITKFKPKVNRK